MLRGLSCAPFVGLGGALACDGKSPSTESPKTVPPQSNPTDSQVPQGDSTMRALSISGYVAELSELALSEVDRPSAGPNEVVVRVRAVALNPVDIALAKGGLHRVAALQFPTVLGWDLSGEVASVGSEVQGYAVGDAVYAGLGFMGGAFAEFAVVPADKLAAAPARLSHLQRAALPLVSCTTVQAMSQTNFSRGGSVLVLGGAGGVGSTAIQWLAYEGATRIVATASETKLDAVRALGCEVIDYRRDDWSRELAGANFDVVYDTVGDDNAAVRATKVLRKGGDYITIAGGTGDTSEFEGKYKFQSFVTHPSGEDLSKVSRAVQEGGLTPLIFREFAFEDIANAYSLCSQRVAVGKIVVAV